MKNGKATRAMEHLDENLIISAMRESDLSGENKDSNIRREYRMKKNATWKRWVAVAAVFVIAISAGFFAGQFFNNQTEMTIALDVNPSLEIEINRRERVTEVNALNKEAELILADMDLENTDIDVAINAIIGSMVQHGYLTVDRNSILVSVDSENTQKANKIQERILRDIDNVLGQQNIDTSVLTQTFEKNEQINQQATENNISPAKAALISKITAAGLKDANGLAYTYETLARLNVNELKVILEAKELQVEGIQSSGEASNGKYISRDEALNKALTQAGLTKENISRTRVELDFEDDYNAMIYEVEFYSGNKEYDYDINAATGAVLDEDIDLRVDKDDDDGEDVPVTLPNNSITREEALNIAYADAGVQASAVKGLEIELDRENGQQVYEIEFKSAGREYDYIINVANGDIVFKENEPIDDDNYNGSGSNINTGNSSSNADTTAPADKLISKDSALNIAYNHAGITASGAREVEIELDRENGQQVYEIEFKSAGREYDYEINAVSGKIIRSESEPID